MSKTLGGFVGDGLRAVPWILVQKGPKSTISVFAELVRKPGPRYCGTAHRPFPTDISLKFLILAVSPYWDYTIQFPI